MIDLTALLYRCQ